MVFRVLHCPGRQVRTCPAIHADPVYWIYLWVPVGFLFTGIQYALTAVRNLHEKDIYLSTTVLEGYDNDEMEI